MKTLHLTLKKKWFDMILSGEKKEEYREIKPYWIKRLIYDEWHEEISCIESLKDALYIQSENGDSENTVFRSDIDYIIFKNGYSKTAREMKVRCTGICLGKTFLKWSDIDNADTFVISLGKILKTKNIKNNQTK